MARRANWWALTFNTRAARRTSTVWPFRTYPCKPWTRPSVAGDLPVSRSGRLKAGLSRPPGAATIHLAGLGRPPETRNPSTGDGQQPTLKDRHEGGEPHARDSGPPGASPGFSAGGTGPSGSPEPGPRSTNHHPDGGGRWHADAARRTLARLQTHAARTGLSLPDPLADTPALIEQAAAAHDPASFCLVKPQLDRLAGQYLQHWPGPADLLQALATAAGGGFDEPGLYPITRQTHPVNDFTRALAANLAAVWPTLEALRPWAFKPADLADFVAACL